ncbi:MAG: hypothetical protein KAU28_07175 [Phycisphaerae bacterium]|nr:hypothetical protein [Phycisphaerae bacterium]
MNRATNATLNSSIHKKPSIWPLIIALALPAIIFAPTLRAPLTHLDDQELHRLAGRTSHSHDIPQTVAEYVRQDMRINGRFRPLFAAERLVLARLLDWGPFALRLLPYGMMLVTTAVLFAIGRGMRLDAWGCVVLAWLVVLNPRGREAWCFLAPQERLGMTFICLALLAMLRGAGSPKKWAWDIFGLLAAMLAVAAKESFVLTLPGLIAARIFAEAPATPKNWKTSLQKNWALLAGLIIIAVIELIFILYALRPQTYSAELLHQVTLWKGLRRVFRHTVSSNAFLIPIVVFFVAYTIKHRHRAGMLKTTILAVSIASLVWLIPTAGLQVKVGSARGRWIYPLTLAPAFANALAFSYLRTHAKATLRRLMDSAIVTWFVYCAAICVAGVSLFYAQASLTGDAVNAIARSVPTNGKVLIVTEAQKHEGMALELRRFIESVSGNNVQVDSIDSASISETPTPDKLNGRLENSNPPSAHDMNLDAYCAIIAAPTWSKIPNRLSERLRETFQPLLIAKQYYPLRLSRRWRETLETQVYLRAAKGKPNRQ